MNIPSVYLWFRGFPKTSGDDGADQSPCVSFQKMPTSIIVNIVFYTLDIVHHDHILLWNNKTLLFLHDLSTSY